MTDTPLIRAKQAVRERVWEALEREGVALPPGAYGRIPNFVGAEAAAERLASLPAWQSGQVIKSNPDTPQWPVRTRALADGKLVYMAVPRLATLKPFYLLDPAELRPPYDEPATPDGAANVAPKVGLEEMRPIDLIVTGSVAVNPAGVRIGKGAGYADIEVALLTEAGLVGSDTIIVTTVHPFQILDEDLPAAEHDFTVDLIVTPDEVLKCGPQSRPSGIQPQLVTAEQAAAIPLLSHRR